MAQKTFTKTVDLTRIPRKYTIARLTRLLQVTSDHVVKIKSYAEVDNGIAISHEYVEGPALQAVKMAKHGLSLAEAQRLLGDLCHGLKALHLQGIIHGDISPTNVLIRSRQPHGRALLVDLVHDKGWEQGTSGFRPAELAHGGAPTPASDLWSAVRVTQWALKQEKQVAFAEKFSDVLTTTPENRPSIQEVLDRLHTAAARITLPEPAELACAQLRIAEDKIRTNRSAQKRVRAKRGTPFRKGVVVLLIAACAYGVTDFFNKDSPVVQERATAVIKREGNTALNSKETTSLKQEVMDLTMQRDQALRSGNVSLLRSLTIPGSPAAQADDALVESMKSAVAAGLETKIRVFDVVGHEETATVRVGITQGPYTWKGGALSGIHVAARKEQCLELILKKLHQHWRIYDVTACNADLRSS